MKVGEIDMIPKIKSIAPLDNFQIQVVFGDGDAIYENLK